MRLLSLLLHGWQLPALALFLCLSGCGSRVELLGQVGEAQANEVLSALLSHGIDADKVLGKEGMVSVRVERERVADAIALMRAEGLPRTQHARMGDVFKKEGLISSPLEERARMVFALSQELSSTITKIDGVITADVHVVLPERAGFGEPANPSSAAVFIKHQDSAPLRQVVPQVRRLVANSISGLDYDKVSVVLIPSSGGLERDAVVAESVWGLGEASPASAQRLRWVFAVLALLCVGALCAAAYLWHRQGRKHA